jgi:hypothetical protein
MPSDVLHNSGSFQRRVELTWPLTCWKTGGTAGHPPTLLNAPVPLGNNRPQPDRAQEWRYSSTDFHVHLWNRLHGGWSTVAIGF